MLLLQCSSARRGGHLDTCPPPQAPGPTGQEKKEKRKKEKRKRKEKKEKKEILKYIFLYILLCTTICIYKHVYCSTRKGGGGTWISASYQSKATNRCLDVSSVFFHQGDGKNYENIYLLTKVYTGVYICVTVYIYSCATLYIIVCSFSSYQKFALA